MALAILMIVGAMGCALGFVGMMTDQSGFAPFGIVHVHRVNYHYAFPWRSRANGYVGEKK